LQEFAFNNGSITIIDGPTFYTCDGYGYGNHKFLAIKGISKCSCCAVLLCPFCIDKSFDNAIRCFDCLWSEVFRVNDLTEDQMRETLEALDVVPPTTASYREVMLLYEDIIKNQKTAAICNNTVNVPFPTNPSKFFNNIDTASTDMINRLTVNAIDLGRVVRDSAMPLTEVCTFVELLSGLVIINSVNGSIVSGKEYKVHTIMLKLLVTFAQGLRAGNEGLCMLKHAV